jgi:signal transduction histidine kinase
LTAHILLVEHSAQRLEALESILTSDAFELTVAASGRQALEVIGRERIDLILSATDLPEMSGYDLCRAIKSDPATTGIPVALLIPLDGAIDVLEGVESGADTFIDTPDDARRLLARLQWLLANRMLRTGSSPDGGIAVCHLGRSVTLKTRPEQILDLLFSTLEDLAHANRELQASRKALGESNAELESLCYSVSHDLRAPLRQIDGFSSALLEDHSDQLDEEAKEHLNEVRGATHAMRTRIDDLVRMARISHGEVKRAPVDLSKLAHQIVATLRAQSPARTVEVTIEDGMDVRGDARLLAILLENLLGNAWKFTAKTERAEIVFGRTRDGDQVSYFVRDNGAGFDMQYADRLFGAFHRLHTTDEFEGTGIGLATVRRILNRHRGRIWASGEPGHGATFHFTLEQ